MVVGLCCHLSLSKNVTFITFLSCNLNLQQDYLFHSIFIRSFPPSHSLLPLSHMASITEEVEKEFLPFNRMYEDGSVERLVGSHYVPPLPNDPETGVTSKDITISQDPSISARLNLPSLNQTHLPKLPILVYFHGGGLCLESAFSFNHQRYLNSLVAQAQVVAVSVEYRLAPEHLLPIAYEDCWAALQWVALHSLNNGLNKEPWLMNHGDFN